MRDSSSLFLEVFVLLPHPSSGTKMKVCRLSSQIDILGGVVQYRSREFSAVQGERRVIWLFRASTRSIVSSSVVVVYLVTTRHIYLSHPQLRLIGSAERGSQQERNNILAFSEYASTTHRITGASLNGV